MTTPLNRRIDFAVVIRVRGANPNGDPLDENRPRILPDGRGEISDVCLKRKIRDRWMEMGEAILVQPQDRALDAYKTIRDRVEGTLGRIPAERTELSALACQTWLDVRSFGHLFAYKTDKNNGKGKGKGKRGKPEAEAGEEESGTEQGALPSSLGIRGPVSLRPAISLQPIDFQSTQITKSANSEGDGSNRASDTMGMKYRIDDATYVTYGSIQVIDAHKCGYTEADAEKLKAALVRLFENDASAARPAGTLDVSHVIWWTHESAVGACSPHKVHATLQVSPEGEVSVQAMPGIACDVIAGW